MLSEIIHHKKINIVQFYLHEVPRVGQNHRDKKWNGSLQGLRGGENGALLFNRYSFSFEK